MRYYYVHLGKCSYSAFFTVLNLPAFKTLKDEVTFPILKQ